MPSYCGACKLDLSRKRSVQCVSCDQWFHLECEDITKEMFSILDKNHNLSFTCKECSSNPTQSHNSAGFKQEMRNEFAFLRTSFHTLEEDMKNNQRELKAKFDSVINDIRKDLSQNLQHMKGEISDCKKLVASYNNVTSKKVCELELQNHLLHYRLCRSDVVITGLSINLTDIKETVMSLCTYLKVDVNSSDILNTVYIKKKTAVLVKFSQIYVRDKLMSEYFRTKSLTRGHVEGGDSTSRVYINDNYSPLVNKLLRLCWKLLKDKKICRYSIINREVPRSKVTMLNGEVKIVSLPDLVGIFNLDE